MNLPASINDALAIAEERGILPTTLSSAEARAALTEEIRDRSVWSARTTNATYLQALRERVNRLLEGGRGGDRSLIRSELKTILAELGYHPETGFPGDELLDIPPATPGTLTDLSSDRRINLILDTQEELMRSAAQRQRGLEPVRLKLFPAWELIRAKTVRVPRDWQARWLAADGPVVRDERGRARLIAAKGDPVWKRLGDSSRFDDALDVATPPFAFNSGMRWREVDATTWRQLLDENEDLARMFEELQDIETMSQAETWAATNRPPSPPRVEPSQADTDLLRRIARRRADARRTGSATGSARPRTWAERLETMKAEAARQAEATNN